MSLPKKHHFVPKCYLKKFKMDGPLNVLNVERLKKYKNEYVRKAEPSSICYYEDYYALDSEIREGLGEIDVHDLFIETDLLPSLEVKYDEFFRKIVYERQLPKEDTLQFCDFLVLLKTRNPYWHTHMLENNKEKWKAIANDALQERVNGDSKIAAKGSAYQELIYKIAKRVFIDNSNFTRQIQLRGLLYRHANIESWNTSYQNEISSHGWLILETPTGGPFFITSDNPGISIGRDQLLYNTRFVDGFWFYFPLSPRFCLVISDDFRTSDWAIHSCKKIRHQSIDEKSVLWLNHILSKRINKLLIAGEESYLTKIVNKNRPSH